MSIARVSCRQWIGVAAITVTREQRHSAMRLSTCSRALRLSTRAEIPSTKSTLKSKSPLTDQLYAYLLDHTREAPVLKKLRVETAGMHGAQMQIPPEQGPFMALLAEITGATLAVEVGVFTGYSSLAVAMGLQCAYHAPLRVCMYCSCKALPDDGVLYACDKDDKSMSVARRYWREAGVAHKIQERVGDGRESLKGLIEEGLAGTFDLAFIDANKRAYLDYYELMLKLVRPGGLIIADNVLFYGKVADDGVQDKYTQALRDFNAHVLNDQRVTLSIVPVGDGMALCRRRA